MIRRHAQAAGRVWWGWVTLVLAFGLFMVLYAFRARVPWLYREERPLLSKVRPGPAGAFPLGMAFAVGWTPCIGPVLGAVLTLDPAAGPVGEQLRAHFPDGADKLTETSGAAAAYEVLGDLLKPHGIIALVGGGPGDVAVPRRHLNSKETMVFGSSAYAPIQFEQIAGFVRRHDVKLDSVVSRFYPLADGPEAFRVAADANTGKVMFRFDGSPVTPQSGRIV